ncbi:EAL domain-containing protein [Musicola keenii]|uniref:EAL domain-containing protein n=1 Tax=Musicola keenii TaxID=2884250 RepID=UPI001CE2DE5B|nr:EAL domain-containing protein [Musicola keenii]
MKNLFSIHLSPLIAREKNIFAFDLTLNQKRGFFDTKKGSDNYIPVPTMNKFQLLALKLQYIRTAWLSSMLPVPVLSIELDRELLIFLVGNKALLDIVGQTKDIRFLVSEHIDIIGDEQSYRALQLLTSMTKIWLNNFGAGRTNISLLNRVTFEYIKIEKSFLLKCGELTFFRKILADINGWSQGAILTGIDNDEMYRQFNARDIYGMQGALWQTTTLMAGYDAVGYMATSDITQPAPFITEGITVANDIYRQ